MIVHVCDGNGCTSIAESGTTTGGRPHGWTSSVQDTNVKPPVWLSLCPKCSGVHWAKPPSDRVFKSVKDAKGKPAERIIISAIRSTR